MRSARNLLAWIFAFKVVLIVASKMRLRTKFCQNGDAENEFVSMRDLTVSSQRPGGIRRWRRRSSSETPEMQIFLKGRRNRH